MMNDDADITIEADGREEAGMSEEDLEVTEGRADAKLTKLKEELATAKKERQEYMDGWQRAKADYVNVLRRLEEETTAARTKGMVKAAQAFITVLDSLNRAEATGEVPDTFKGITKQLHDAANSLGLTPFGEVGEAFDPNLHEALGQDPVEDAQLDDTVTAVLEQGWKTGDTVIRAAKVRVGTTG